MAIKGHQPPQPFHIILRIRYVIQNHCGQLDIGDREKEWGRNINVKLKGKSGRSPDARMIDRLLLTNDQTRYPGATIEALRTFICGANAHVKNSWFNDPLSMDAFNKLIAQAFTKWQEETDSKHLGEAGLSASKALTTPHAHDTIIHDDNLDYGAQTDARALVGQYIIFRRIHSAPAEWLLSIMTVEEPGRASGPCRFTTVSPGRTPRPPLEVVKGIFYDIGENPPVIHTLGTIYRRYANGTETATLERRFSRLNLIRNDTNADYDLIGIRLGKGRRHDESRAYLIWCARLLKPIPDEVSNELVESCKLAKELMRYDEYVGGLKEITSWLEQKDRFVSIDLEEEYAFVRDARRAAAKTASKKKAGRKPRRPSVRT